MCILLVDSKFMLPNYGMNKCSIGSLYDRKSGFISSVRNSLFLLMTFPECRIQDHSRVRFRTRDGDQVHLGFFEKKNLFASYKAVETAYYTSVIQNKQ
jgi:hypothetical protein